LIALLAKLTVILEPISDFFTDARYILQRAFLWASLSTIGLTLSLVGMLVVNGGFSFFLGLMLVVVLASYMNLYKEIKNSDTFREEKERFKSKRKNKTVESAVEEPTPLEYL
jgi:hypothetical protein